MSLCALPTPSQPLRQPTQPGWTLPRATRQSGTWRETLPECCRWPRRPRKTKLSSKTIQSLLTFATGIKIFCSTVSVFTLFKRWARDATVGAEGCPIGVQVSLCQSFSGVWFFSSGGRQTLPGGDGHPCNENHRRAFTRENVADPVRLEWSMYVAKSRRKNNGQTIYKAACYKNIWNIYWCFTKIVMKD